MPEIIRIVIKAASGQYEVRIGSSILEGVGEQLRQLKVGTNVALVCDSALADTLGLKLEKALVSGGYTVTLLPVSGGETAKNMNEVTRLLSILAQQKLTRTDTVIALGGGVVGDLAGFVAAIYLRGINLVQIPTTLLAMVDSSVGGKTGVNLPEGKNLVGATYPPRLVLADADCLSSLPPRELASGMAEVIKHGIIADPALLDYVAKGVPSDLCDLISRNVEIKARVVEQDEKETGTARMALNFGHTVGHAIEQASGYGTYKHGEAISIGIRAACHLSQRKVGLSAKEVEKVEQTLKANNLPMEAKGLSHKAIWEAMLRDKKVRGTAITWVLCPRLGEVITSTDVSKEDVDEVLKLVLV